MPYRIPVGPFHPALEEPYKLSVSCQGEIIQGVSIEIGFSFRAIELLAQQRNYIQDLTLVERVCGICSGVHTLTFCMAAEALAGIRVPDRGRFLRVIVAELAIRGLADGLLPRVYVEPIPRFPEVERDLAVIVDDSRTAAEVQATIARHGGELLRGVRLFDLYRGAPLAATEKSLAYRLVFGTNDRTLTEGEVDEAMAAVRDGLAADLAAHIRS